MIGWVFPGQGSQHVGMGAGLESREARDTLTEASEVLGWDVLRVCRDGPAERLDSTEITQPAVLATSVAPARDELARALEGVAFSAPRVRFFSGVTGRSHDRPGEIRELLVRGVTEPVRWMDAVLGMRRAGAELFVEAGPGEVLSGLVRR